MSKFNNAPKAIIPTPVSLTEAQFNTTISIMVAHYSTILTTELLIAHRKGCYASIINTTINGVALDVVLGSTNAKVATEMALSELTTAISNIAH